MKSLNILFKRWNHEGVDLFAPVDEEVVRSTFSKMGMMPSQDIIDLYGLLGGMHMMDTEYWRLWSLSEIEEEFDQGNEYGVLFSDYLICSWSYRIKPSDLKSSAVYVDHFNGRPPILVAESLNQFFNLYVANASDLLDGPKTQPGTM